MSSSLPTSKHLRAQIAAITCCHISEGADGGQVHVDLKFVSQFAFGLCVKSQREWVHTCVRACCFFSCAYICVCGCMQIWANTRDLPLAVFLLLQALIHNHKKDLSDNFCEPLERLLRATNPEKVHLFEVQRKPAWHLRRTCVCERAHTCSMRIMYRR